MKENTKPKYNMWQNTAWMIGLAWREQEKKVLVLAALSAPMAVATNLVNLYVVPTILGTVERHAPLTELAGTILCFILALMVCNAATRYIDSNTLYGRITLRSVISRNITRKTLHTSYPNLFEDQFQSLFTKSLDATSNNGEATEAIWNTLTELAKNILGFTLYLVLLNAVSPLLFAVILITAFISFFVTKYCNNYLYTRRKDVAQLQKRISYITGRAQDISAAKDIRIFGLRPWLEDMHVKLLEAYTALHAGAHTRILYAKIADLVLVFLRNGLAYAYLIGLVLSGGLTAPEFLLYFSAVSGFAAWVTGILNQVSTLHRQSIDLSSIREFLAYPEPFRFDGGIPLTPQPGAQHELKMENVSFRYPGAEGDTLKQINLTLHPGEKIAVVGLNGAGKTTLIKLLCGFLDPTEGRVLLDGADIRDFNRADYYTIFSAVFQDFLILPASVAENVAQAEHAQIDLARVHSCVEKAGLTEKIESLPNAYDTLLNREVHEDAATLSGGEAQRLMLARALYQDAPFIMLDEPTAALDPIAEADLYQKYHEMTMGKASVYISHRLASTRFCDRILYLENGIIAEEGTHADLLARSGRYAELFAVQSQYYQEGDANHEA